MVNEISPFSSIRELAKAIRSKKVSSIELTQMYIHRLETLGEEHQAVAQMTTELAMKQARAADNSEPKSLLHGIPFGVKDLFSVKGYKTRWGSKGHDDQEFPYTATAVQRLFDRGGVLIAKLAMIELAGGGNYDSPGASSTGACLSAWDKTRWAGGSSSGSGAATGLGAVGYSLGTETSGSILCPSSFNGDTGFRPTYGRVSRHGAMALAWTHDKIGPICRSADDCQIVLEAIAGPDPLDRSTIQRPFSPRLKGRKPVIGLMKQNFRKYKASACEKAYDEAIKVFHKMGYETVDVTLPKKPYDTAVSIIVNAEGASAHEHFIRSEKLSLVADPVQMAGLLASLETPATDYLWALRFRSEAPQANSMWDKCDGIFMPVFYHGAVPADESLGKSFANMGGGDEGPANLLGWPALTFPIGFDTVGLPLNGQILCPCYGESTCLRVAKDFQRETDFHLKHPIV